MVKAFYYLFKEIRPRQWIKNLTLFVAVFFTGQFFNLSLLTTSFWAFLAFCAASSSLYIFNDFKDLDQDKLHPFKKNRPLASGKLNPKLAKTAAIILSILAFFLSAKISNSFLLMTALFYFLQLAYNLFLKDIILLDILAIAAGFILRVFAGEVATGWHIDIWLFLTIVSVALFLAIGKRRSELTLLSGFTGTRKTLSHYSEKMLDVYLSMFANSAWITYAFYAFLQRPPVFRRRVSYLFDQYNLDLFQDRKWLMLTIPLVIYGVMRYLQLIYEKNEGESPEKVILSDKPLMFTGIILGLTLFGIIYILGK